MVHPSRSVSHACTLCFVIPAPDRAAQANLDLFVIPAASSHFSSRICTTSVSHALGCFVSGVAARAVLAAAPRAVRHTEYDDGADRQLCMGRCKVRERGTLPRSVIFSTAECEISLNGSVRQRQTSRGVEGGGDAACAAAVVVASVACTARALRSAAHTPRGCRRLDAQ
eukprot:6204697-Pleurochrysis_carterae.AAC.1